MTRRPAAIDVEELARLRTAGQTLGQLAEHFHVTSRTISRTLTKHGLAAPNPHAGKRVTEEWKAKADRLLDEGLSLIETARTTGVSYCTVSRHFPGRGWDSTTSGKYAHAVRKANRELSRIGVAPLRPSAPVRIAA